MKKKLCAMLCCLALISSLGCVEMERTITLNPDGKGKMKIDAIMPATLSIGATPNAGTVEDEKKQIASKMLTQSTGVTGVEGRLGRMDARWSAPFRRHGLFR